MPSLSSLISLLKNSPAARSALGAATGTGVAALENTMIDDPNLKNVNYGLGAVTGGIAGLGSIPAQKILGGLAGKQVGLLATDAYLRDAPARKQTAELNRQTAKTELQTAQTKADQANRWSNQDKLLAALAAAGIGAAGIYGYNSFRNKKPKSKEKDVLKGDPSMPRRQKLKIEVPAASLPPEFFRSLIDADDRERALTTLETKSASIELELDRSAILAGIASDLDDLEVKRAATRQPAAPSGSQPMSGFSRAVNRWLAGSGSGTTSVFRNPASETPSIRNVFGNGPSVIGSVFGKSTDQARSQQRVHDEAMKNPAGWSNPADRQRYEAAMRMRPYQIGIALKAPNPYAYGYRSPAQSGTIQTMPRISQPSMKQTPMQYLIDENGKRRGPAPIMFSNR